MNTHAKPNPYAGLHLGVVPYLNVKPLIWNIEALAPGLEVIAAVPRDLTAMLDAGQVDVGIIPVAAYFHHPGYSIVPGISIACKGEARSVVLFSKVPVEQISSVLLDRSSLSSIALFRVLLREHFQISPVLTLSEEPISCFPLSKESSCDAFLIIGNAAMQVQEPFPYRYDLGEAWHQLSGLPFVFAFWGVREGQHLRGFDRVLVRSKQDGLKHLADIARAESQHLNIPESLCYQYLSRNMQYDLGECELRGIRRFQELLAAQGLCPPHVELKFYRA